VSWEISYIFIWPKLSYQFGPQSEHAAPPPWPDKTTLVGGAPLETPKTRQNFLAPSPCNVNVTEIGFIRRRLRTAFESAGLLRKILIILKFLSAILTGHHEEPSCNGFAPCRMVVGGHHDGAWLWCTGAAPMVSIEDNEPKPEEGPTTTDQESSASQRAGSEVPVIK
jgi:hypothetical protein